MTLYTERQNLYRELEQARNSRVITYITGDRPGLEIEIHQEVYDRFVNHLDIIGVVPKITLFLYTRGGDTLVAWSLVNLIKQFCDDFEVVVPSKSHSAWTLMCLGANRIVMTKQATLGPVDPSVNSPLNPQIPGAPPSAKVPVSVEAIRGFTDLARGELHIKNQRDLSTILLKLSESVHPLVLGHVYRARSQIRMLAERLVSTQTKDRKKRKRIIDFLCSDSGSHDYSIHRREARDMLGLTIEKPDDVLYNLIKRIYDDIAGDLELDSKFDVVSFMSGQQQRPYQFKRGLIESVTGGSHYFATEGQIQRVQIPIGQNQFKQELSDNRQFEGWRHV
jgi:hypothetical protein